MMKPSCPGPIAGLALLLLALAGCGAAPDEDGCIPPDDPRALDPGRDNSLKICPAVRGGGAAPPTGPAEESCPAADVPAWRVSLSYSGELGAVSPDGRQQVEHQVTAELEGTLQMSRRSNASGEDWAPRGKATQQMREYRDGELEAVIVGEGAPVPGNPTTITDSRILLSIVAHNCTYNLYSSGTTPVQVTRGGRVQEGKNGYGTVFIRNQPATLSIGGSQPVPIVYAPDDPRVEMPDIYIAGIGDGGRVNVTWRIEPAE